MHKVIFMDIDGVINSYRSVIAYGTYPMDNTTIDNFDEIAIGMLRSACKKCNAEIILSSTWRNENNWGNLKEIFNLPIIDRTPQLFSGTRGHEINAWLKDNTVFEFVIIDDHNEILDSQQNNFVQTDPKEGLAYRDYEKILKILGVEKNE